MFPYYKAKKEGKKKKCFIYKKKDGSEKDLDLKVRRSFLLSHLFNNQTPESFPLVPTTISNDDLLVVYKCCLFSYLSYKNRSLIEFPPEVKIRYEKFDSNISRIPFFIVLDSSINAIVVSCRGSSCLDDFITDSLGNGVTYNGGKFHQGVFSTASYVFMTCQTKLIELNELLNSNSTQENENDDIDNSPEFEYYPESDTDDYTEEESDDEDNESGNSRRKLSSILSGHLHLDHKSSASSSKSLFSSKSDSNDNLSSSNSNENLDVTQELDPEYLRKMRRKPTKIIITGHSLGAAVAAVVTYLFKEKFPELNVQCICFAPPPTLTFDLWQTTGDYIKSYIIEGDPVPFLSVQNIINASDVLFPREHSNKAIKKLIQSYLSKKSIENFEAISAKEERLYPPGQLFLIRFTNKEKDKNFVEKNIEKIKKKKEKLKKKLQDVKNKLDKKGNKNDNDENENDEGILVKDSQLEISQVIDPEYFTNYVTNIQEKNHFMKNYMRLVIRLMNKYRRLSDLNSE